MSARFCTAAVAAPETQSAAGSEQVSEARLTHRFVRATAECVSGVSIRTQALAACGVQAYLRNGASTGVSARRFV